VKKNTFSLDFYFLALGEPLRRPLGGSRRAIRSITFAPFGRYGGSAAIPLAAAASLPP
jgi:hypothetical protein